MQISEFFSLVNKKKGTIASLVFIFLILALILTIFQPVKYGATARILVIQNFSNPDPYQASKSTEYLSNILAKVVYSNSFFENVLSSGYFIDKNYFGVTIKDQMEKWSKTISAKPLNDSGIIALAVYHSSRAQAESIARAVVYTLQTKHSLYHGNGGNVSIKIIDEPITSNFPVKPDLIMNFGLAFVLGLIFSFAYVYLYPAENYSLSLIPRYFRKAKPVVIYRHPIEKPVSAIGDYQPSFLPRAFADEPVLEEEAANDLNDLSIDNQSDYDDLDIRQEIANRGSMKNIF